MSRRCDRTANVFEIQRRFTSQGWTILEISAGFVWAALFLPGDPMPEAMARMPIDHPASDMPVVL